jgi:acyl carrier protein
MSNETTDLHETIYDVLRTDLKLGMVELGPETPLVGDELGLDSLDLLMVVTGTEKRLGIKIPNDKLGRDTMGTIGAFVLFVDSLRTEA